MTENAAHSQDSGATVQSNGPDATTSVESHSVDWIPLEERHGKPWHVGAVWFVSNMNITPMATGVAAYSMGGHESLLWSIVATVLGALFGTIFMAFHASQGPHLGLPQLVQSRPQFGYIGAAFTMWIFALINYGAYNISDAIMSGAAGEYVLGTPPWVAYLLFGGIGTIIAILGYRMIHLVNQIMAIPLTLVTIFATVAAFYNVDFSWSMLSPGQFDAVGFFSIFVVVAGFQLGWAPYVSDYSRYLSPRTKPSHVLWWTYIPSVFAGIWVFLIGILAGAKAPGKDPSTAVAMACDQFMHGAGSVALVAMVIGLISIMSLNQYGGSLTLISILDSFVKVKPTKTIRVISVLVLFACVSVVAQMVGPERFNGFYANLMIYLAYAFTPWTAVNLADYFLVRKGKYVISEIYNPDGIYGKWGGRGILAYLIGLAAMAPFMVCNLFTGFIASRLHGVDISMFVGLPVAAIAYWLLCRSLDLGREQRMADAEGKVNSLGDD